MNLVRMEIDVPALFRFAKGHKLLQSRNDDDGYLLHAWLAAAFGPLAPKPFWFDERHATLWGYTQAGADQMLDHLQSFADPRTYAAMKPDTLHSKPLPQCWRPGLRVLLQTRLCPVTRHGGEEKDAFLWALDAWDAAQALHREAEKPTRESVYCQWFVRQVDPQAAQLEAVRLVGLRARVAMVRPDRSADSSRLRVIERPEASVEAVATVQNGDAFAQMLERGIGRHRAFGFGMVRVLPAP